MTHLQLVKFPFDNIYGAIEIEDVSPHSIIIETVGEEPAIQLSSDEKIASKLDTSDKAAKDQPVMNDTTSEGESQKDPLVHGDHFKLL
ncbi:hypothetical protein BGZ99_004925 [Dissophora globulifera]|uniref:Uncharacterized protein n=1 Tax=Dissophora globulifera TaxID=979702 RepID=A0A9P6RTP4_9FUNG|nr:hypothetical protein BGZ99_004925 [Dissophora globulifera]